MKLQDYYTLPKAAPLIGKGQATLYRWVKRNKIQSVKFGGILFISYETIRAIRVKSCSTCFHSTNGLCSCREATDMVHDGCSDWYPIELRGI